MKEYKITGKFLMYVSGHNKEEALEKAYAELDEATNCTDIYTEVNEIELIEE